MITIMVDSAAGISRQEAEELGAHYVPMTYTVDRQQFVEHYIGENGQFEPYIEREDVERRTSQATAAAFVSAFEQQVAKGRQVLCITISSRLSGTYANAVMAAKEVNADEIRVLDSRNCAGGIYFLIQRAQKLIDQGLNLAEIAEKLASERKLINNVFTVNDMTNLRKSGRLGVVRLSVSTILNLRPILCLQNGSVFSRGVARGSHEQLRMLAESVPENVKFVVIHSRENNPQLPLLQEMLRKRLGDGLELRIVSLGPVLAIHLGLTYLGVCWIDEKPAGKDS
ncbi:MAG TPA: DegV family protein [Candidatus Limiplasma sp.]|nr:DegV family protein [Candidatus Limiplasma sp.]HPR77242.1 DegV family protein [Candidatus Limiplasma sp.]